MVSQIASPLPSKFPTSKVGGAKTARDFFVITGRDPALQAKKIQREVVAEICKRLTGIIRFEKEFAPIKAKYGPDTQFIQFEETGEVYVNQQHISLLSELPHECLKKITKIEVIKTDEWEEMMRQVLITKEKVIKEAMFITWPLIGSHKAYLALHERNNSTYENPQSRILIKITTMVKHVLERSEITLEKSLRDLEKVDKELPIETSPLLQSLIYEECEKITPESAERYDPKAIPRVWKVTESKIKELLAG